MHLGVTKGALLRMAAVFGSAVLLATAFPPVGEAQAAWLALIPLILVARWVSPGRAFYYGWGCGTLFWMISLRWFWRLGDSGCPMPVAVLAWLALSLYLGVFRGGFAATTAWAFRVVNASARDRAYVPFYRSLPLVLILPMLWVGFEYWRGLVGSGFPWNGLGVSQYRNLPVIQLAEWGGVGLVSAVVVAVNTGIALMLIRVSNVYRGGRRVRLQAELMIVLLLLVFVWVSGVSRVRRLQASEGDETHPVRVVAIQPNIPQLKKWPEEFAQEIYATFEERMDVAVALRDSIDLVVWPETAVPGYLPHDAEWDAVVRQFAQEMKTPLLVGAMEIGGLYPGAGARTTEGVARQPQPWDWILYNSSFLYGADGEILDRYRKQHLVPFGEYLPLDRYSSLIRRMEPLGFSCRAGETGTVFRVDLTDGTSVPFSSLICFEDLFSGLARRMVRNGARMLINQTNDAWFDPSFAPVQHMSHCVFRCVENRVPAVRAANTGVTCFIDRTGRIDETSQGIVKRKEWRGIGYRTETVRVPDEFMPPTFYTRFGDASFSLPCGVVAALASVLVWRSRRKET